MTQALTIGQLARTTGVPAKTIRYYEQVGVLPPPARTPAGYRQYTRRGVHRLLFMGRARALGLSLQHLKTLAAALDGGPRGAVRSRLRDVVRAQLSAVHAQRAELQRRERQLEQVLRRLRAPGRREQAAAGCRCLGA